METVLVLLVFISFGAMIAGLIRPSAVRVTTRGKVLGIYGVTTLAFFILFAFVAEPVATDATGSTGQGDQAELVAVTPQAEEGQVNNAAAVSTTVAESAEEGSEEQMLAVAADIRRHLREQDVPAYVVASGTRLSISYRAALIDYAPETFFRQQGHEGIRRLASAGFETLVIEAKDANGRTQRRKFPIASLVAQVVTDSVSRARTRAEISGVRLIPWTLPANGREAQMVLTDWRNTGERPIRVVHADIIAYDDRGTEIDSSARDYTIYAVCNSAPGIAPGEEYREPEGEGFVLIPIPTLVPLAHRVAVRITSVGENPSC